jgi:hypothetical protein
VAQRGGLSPVEFERSVLLLELDLRPARVMPADHVFLNFEALAVGGLLHAPPVSVHMLEEGKFVGCVGVVVVVKEGGGRATGVSHRGREGGGGRGTLRYEGGRRRNKRGNGRRAKQPYTLSLTLDWSPPRPLLALTPSSHTSLPPFSLLLPLPAPPPPYPVCCCSPFAEPSATPPTSLPPPHPPLLVPLPPPLGHLLSSFLRRLATMPSFLSSPVGSPHTHQAHTSQGRGHTRVTSVSVTTGE